MAPELAAEVLRAELGMPPNEAFAEFSPNPIAAASIGQVHIARHHDGRQLAVKIQYPGVAHAIRTDLRNTELVAVFMQLLRSVVPGLSRSDPKALAAEISERITEELDYEVEATNQSYFADVYRGHPFIRIPEVVPEVSTSRVLTQELAEGLNWNEAIEADQELRNLWGEVIWRFGHGSLRRLGVFNADPHPGNYIFHLDGTVTFLDFGCVKRFTPSQVTEVKAIYRAGAEGDWEGLCQVLNEGGTFDLKHGLTVDELVQHFRTRNELFITGPQPFTVTPEMLNGMLEQELSLKGVDGKFVRTVKNAHAWMFYMRLELGIYGVLAGLRASAEGLAIVRELDGGAPPLTDLGKQEESFWLAREATA
jgi:predicted unusual protein kinase regulating ubiquinone biosynthesis (AarF/ABC1/UbiB family)